MTPEESLRQVVSLIQAYLAWYSQTKDADQMRARLEQVEEILLRMN